MRSLEEEVIGIEGELSAIFGLASKYASNPGVFTARFEEGPTGISEALLVFPFKKKERVKIILPYLGVNARGSAAGILEVIDETFTRPVTIFRGEFYAEAELVQTTRSFASLHISDESGYGQGIIEQKYRIRFTPGASNSTLRVTLRSFYVGVNEVFDIYGVVF